MNSRLDCCVKAIDVPSSVGLPKDALAYTLWGYALRAQGKQAEAAEKLSRAAELSRSNSQ
jgi:hypothetical protein